MRFRSKADPRRRTYLSLIRDIDNGLRDAYAIRFAQKRENQSSIAKKLKVNRSVIHRRLTGRSNLTIESIADLVWAMGHAISIRIYDPEQVQGQNYSTMIATASAGPVGQASFQTVPTPAAKASLPPTQTNVQKPFDASKVLVAS